MSTTDYLGLSEHKIFETLRETLPKDVASSRSLIVVRDDMLYAWNYQDNCVLALNIKTARSHDGEGILHQTLLPISPPLFTPERLIVNEDNSLLVAFGANGVLVFELPRITPPYGTFNNNKDIIYTRTHSLHERALAFSTKIEVRQVRFHPGSPHDNHVCVLTNDNIFHVFAIENASVTQQGVFQVGPSVTCNVPSSHMSIQEALGETAVDFDFGPPEVTQQPRSLTKKDLKWPIYFLAGDATVHIITLTLGERNHPGLHGPHTIRPLPGGKMSSEYCSILVFHTTPPLLSIANCNGHVSHVLALENFTPTQGHVVRNTAVGDGDEDEVETPAYIRPRSKVMVLLETLELELGYTIHNCSEYEYSCPIYLHKDEARVGNYFATHEAGIHAIEVGCIESLHKYADGGDNIEDSLQEIVNKFSTIDYLLCTKISADVPNPVIGFALYHNPHSYVALLANGQLVTLAVMATLLPQHEYYDDNEGETIGSPLKKMLSSQFDVHIQRILKQGATLPILKLSGNEEKTQQDCYELLQRAAVVLREKFKNHERAREEIEKRVKALVMIKEYQHNELEKMCHEKMVLQENAENLAEKYEDLKDKQEDVLKRCQTLLISISKHQDVPSHAEKEFHVKLKSFDEKIEHFQQAITKLKNKIKYQDCQMKNHQAQSQKNMELNHEQSESFKASLVETTRKVSDMMKELNEYKTQLNIY